jgi:hypothetical protein
MKKIPPFDQLAMVDKAWLLDEFGDYLMSIEYYEHRIFLYSFNNSFVELFENIDTRQVEKIETAPYGALDKYLSRIFIWKTLNKS